MLSIKGYYTQLLLSAVMASIMNPAELYSQETGKTELIKYGDMESWITRNLKESAIIGGANKKVYEIGPTTTIDGNKAYTPLGGSPWGTSNVYARVSGITKTSNAVFPVERPGAGKAVKLATQIETVKVLGLINMDVMVSGSIFLGQMFEPITSTKNPYSKMEMGVPFTKRPDALVFDYKVEVPETNTRTKSSGFGKKTTMAGRDKAMVFLFLQKRWETPDGKLHAKRVGTAGEYYSKSTPWTNGHRVKIHYGDASGIFPDDNIIGLRHKGRGYWARNSKGEMTEVVEEGWADADETPTHLVMMLSAGSAEPYVGTEGLTLYVDNVGLAY